MTVEPRPQLHVSWNEYDGMMSKIYRDIVDLISTEQCSGIYGIPSGGLVPAVSIHNHFNLPLLLSPIDGCIVIDDIVDTGSTFKHLTQYGRKLLLSIALARRFNSKYIPNICGLILSENDDRWITFPWES